MRTPSSTLIRITCVLLVLASVLAGCGGTPAPTAAPTTAPTAAPTQAAKPTAVPATATAVPPTAVPATPTSGPVTGGMLIVAAMFDPDTLDPHITGNANGEPMVVMGSTLVDLSPKGEYVPYAAENWTISPDGKVWEFKLKKGVKFHSGKACTAQDWVWTYQRALDPATKATAAATLLAPIASAKAVDDYTLQLTLNEPYFALLFALSSYYSQPLNKEQVEKLGDQYGRNPDGIGPLKFKEWKTGQKLVLVRNDEFNWGPAYAHKGPVYVDGIEYRMIGEQATQIAGLEAGELDTAGIEPKDVERMKAQGFQVFQKMSAGMYGLYFNCKRAPFDDVKVRQALSYAVDKDKLIKVVLLGNGVPVFGPISPNVLGYSPEVEKIGYHYDAAKAKAKLAEAGYTPGSDGIMQKDGKALKFAMVTFSFWIKSLEVIQQDLKAIGVDAQIMQEDPGVLSNQLLQLDYDVAMYGYNYPDADILRIVYHSDAVGGFNAMYAVNPDLDKVLQVVRGAVDPTKRQEAANQAQKIIVENAYVLPLYAETTFGAVSPRVKGIEIKSTGDTSLWNIYLVKK